MTINWIYNGKEVAEADNISEGYVAFVYLIENLINKRKYIGKKIFVSTTRKRPLKGKTRKRKVTKDSGWREYWGSCIELNDDIKFLGEENFRKTIICLCKTRGMASYMEAKYQFEYGVLESDEFYNGQIRVRVHKSHVKF